MKKLVSVLVLALVGVSAAYADQCPSTVTCNRTTNPYFCDLSSDNNDWSYNNETNGLVKATYSFYGADAATYPGTIMCIYSTNNNSNLIDYISNSNYTPTGPNWDNGLCLNQNNPSDCLFNPQQAK